MDFVDLYHAVEAEGGRPAPFEFLRRSVVADIPWLEDVFVWRLVHNPPTREARYTLFDDRTSAYGDEFLVADISFCCSLESDPPQLWFALTKELMHVFDKRETWIDSREKFIKFLKDLQNTPLDIENGSVNSEHMARWMAILVLCPRQTRDEIRDHLTNDTKLLAELAEEWGLPEWLISIAVDDYYDTAYKVLITR